MRSAARRPYQPPLLAEAGNPRKIATGAPPSENEIGARRVLATLWPLCEPHLPPAAPVSRWRHRNKRAALEIAALGIGEEAIHAAHARASLRLRGKCWSVQIVADELREEIERQRERERARESVTVATSEALDALR